MNSSRRTSVKVLISLGSGLLAAAIFEIHRRPAPLVGPRDVDGPSPSSRGPDLTGRCVTETADAVTAPPTPTETEVEFVFRDVASEMPVAGLAVVDPEVGAYPITAGPRGELHWPRTKKLPKVADDRWKAMGDGLDLDSRFDAPVIWIARRVRIRGHVVAAPGEVGPVPTREIRVSLVAMAPPESTIESYCQATLLAPTGPRSASWRSAHRVERTSPVRYERSTGEFEFEAVALADMGLKAMGRGWSCGPQSISALLRTGMSVVEVDVAVRRRPRVVGRVLDESGAPVAGAKVRLQLHRTFPKGVVEPDRIAELGFGFCYVGRPDGTAGVYLGAIGRTDSQGSFEVEGPSELDWAATLFVVADSSTAPSRSEVRIGPNIDPVKVELRSSPGSVKLMESGVPLVGASVLICDLTDRRNQLSLGCISSNSEGRLNSGWFEMGRDYLLYVTRSGSLSGSPFFVRWSAPGSIDLASLHSGLTAFEESMEKSPR